MRYKLVTSIALILLLASTLTITLHVQPVKAQPANATVTVDGSVTYQTIAGFGGSGAFYQNYLDSMQEPARTQVANLLFTDLGTSIYRLRVWTGIEPSNGTFDFNNTDPDQVWTATKAKDRGVTQFMASVWTPPAWMKSNGQETNGGYLLPSMYQAFANYLAAYVKGYQQYHNINISYISIQNEPNWPATYQSCLYNATQMRDVVKVVGATFEAEGITTKIVVPETTGASNAPDYISTIMADPNASKYVDVFANHLYDIPFFNPDAGISSLQAVANLSTQYNKPIWQTEYSYLQTSGANTFQEALCTAEQINNVLTYMNGSAYLVWGLFWPQDGTGQGLITIPYLGASTYTITPKFYAVKQYSKFITPGSKRIEAASNNTSILVSAYMNEANGNVTIVAINTGSSSITTTFNLKNVSSTYFKQYQTSASENCTYIGSIAVSNNSFDATLPPQSITTFTTSYPFGPTPKFTFSPSVPYVNETVTFDAFTSLPGWNDTNEVPIANYTWNFGDGTSNVTTTGASNYTISHAFTAVGNYTVTLTVEDLRGWLDTVSEIIRVSPMPSALNLNTGINYLTIQSAINAPQTLKGNTIFVGEGTYYEHVVVNKSLSLIGESKSNTIIDGSGTGNVITITANNVNLTGFTIQNSGPSPNAGIYIHGSNRSTISQNNIANNGYGIWLISSASNTIGGNNITANSFAGIEIDSSSNNSIGGNDITANSFAGIEIDSSSNNSIGGNTFTDDGLIVSGSYHNSVENNTVNGKPLVYLEGVANYGVGDAGQVILVRCNIIKVENLNLSGASAGVELLETNNSIISRNNIANNDEGIWLISSASNTIGGNNITANSFAGIEIDSSSNNSIGGNNIANNDEGIWLISSASNSISGNNIANNYFGIWLTSSSNNSIDGNSIANKYCGIVLFSSSNNNIISGNNIANSYCGIYLSSSSSNRFFHNNFNYNYQQVYSYNSKNVWDNGYPSGGNYWSDYTGVDLYSGPGQNLPGSDGIGDTPYVIDANNTDHYPLMKPWLSGIISVAISPSSATMDVGQSQVFAAIALGGTPPHTYQWCLNNVAVSGATSSMWTFKPSSAGSYTVFLNVTDNTGLRAESKVAFITVNPAPSVSISPASVTLDAGQSQQFTSTVTGGTSPYTYQWYMNGTAVSGATNSSYTFSSSSAGTFLIYVNVTDNLGIEAGSNTVTVTVHSGLGVSVSPSSVTMDVGQPQTFTSSISGGTSPYTYQWYLNGSVVTGATGSSWTFTPSSAGSYSVYVKVTDSASSPNAAQSSSASVTVNSALSIGISPSSATLNVGKSQTFTSSVSGGMSPYTYQWYMNGTAVSGATSSTWIFMSSPGSYSVYVNITDNAGFRAKSNIASITVNSPSVTVKSSSSSPLPLSVSEMIPYVFAAIIIIAVVVAAVVLTRRKKKN